MPEPLARRLIAWRPAQRIRAGVGEGLRIGRRGASANYAVGTNELPVQHALADLLHPGDVFVDVGANVGFFSLLAARLVGPRGRVYSLEPVPANVAALRANVRRNGFDQMTVMPVAAADRVGTSSLITTEHPGGAALEGAARPPDATATIDVATTTIDALIESGTVPPPTLVKVDVEGAELAVLSGMPNTLRVERPALIVEVDGEDDEALDRHRLPILDLLIQAAYDVEPLDRSYQELDWRVAHFVARPR